MPFVRYAGSFNGASGGNGVPASLSVPQGSEITSVPSGAVIVGVSYALKISARKYSSSENWIMQQLAVGGYGGSPNAYATAGMYSSDHTFAGNMDFSPAGDAGKFANNTIDVFAIAYTTHDVDSFLWDVEIVVEYAFPEKCVEPSEVTINGSAGMVNTPDATVVLAWSGAEAGSANRIRGYLIRSQDSTDGESWGDAVIVGEVAETATSGSTTVDVPEIGIRRKFTVQTLSEYGSAYNSENAAESPIVVGGHEPLEGFTDDPLTAGATPIKALHMQELQDRVATLRAFYGLSAFAFSEIIAGQTSLAGWTAHVLEIRAALDEISENHAAWLTITENKPRVDVMQQLREVVMLL